MSNTENNNSGPPRQVRTDAEYMRPRQKSLFTEEIILVKFVAIGESRNLHWQLRLVRLTIKMGRKLFHTKTTAYI